MSSVPLNVKPGEPQPILPGGSPDQALKIVPGTPPPPAAPRLEEARPACAPPSPDQERSAMAAAVSAAERQGATNRTGADSGPTGASLEGERRAKLEALEASSYGQLVDGKTGQPIFSKAELEILATDPTKLSAKKRKDRTALQKKAYDHKRSERERLEREHQDKLKAAQEAKTRELALQAVVTRTGREPFETVWNPGVDLAQLIRAVPAEAAILKFQKEEVDKLAPDMAAVLTKYPDLAKWICLEIPEARLAIMLAACMGVKVKAYKEILEAKAAAEAARRKAA